MTASLDCSPACDRRTSVQRLIALAVLTLICLVAMAAGADKASATEPVFDTTYDTRLGNIVRGTLSASSADYLALEEEARKSEAGDRTASRVLGMLQRLRADTGNAVPLRKFSIPADGSVRVYWYTNGGDYWQKLRTGTGGPGWYWGGMAAGSYVCSLSNPAPTPGYDFHQLYISGAGCYMEALPNYNDDDTIRGRRTAFASGAGGVGIEFDGGCQHAIAAFNYAPSPCVAAIFPDRLFWVNLDGITNQQVYTTQTYDVFVGYQWWDTSWNPFNAPTSQSTALTDTRALIDDADNALLRAWLNHRFDPANYTAPLPEHRTLGAAGCTPGGNNLDANVCEQASR